MARMHQHCAREAGSVERLDGLALKTDAVVALEHWLRLAAVATGDAAVALADGRRNVRDLETSCFAGVGRASERIQCLEEKRSDEERLQSPRFSLLHLLFDRE